jgi:LysM repeat protein
VLIAPWEHDTAKEGVPMVSRQMLSRAVSGGFAAAVLTIGGVGLSASAATAAPRNPWNAIAQCESGGNWSINTGNGYYGGLQFSAATWAAYGGRGSAATASRAEQIAIGRRVVARQGWSAWSSCSSRLGLYGHTDPTASTTSAPKHHTKSRAAAHRTTARHRAETVASSTETTHHPHHRARHAAHRTGRHAATPVVSRTTYTVRSGDTLAAIAAHLRITGGWQALADVNAAHISHPSRIAPGQVLRLPAV